MSNGSFGKTSDIVLIGGGIMSATLGVLLRDLFPTQSITVFERGDEVAQESSGAWNNAGTGHAALCELNYTPRRADGTIDTAKAFAVNRQFHDTRALWSTLVEQGRLSEPERFIRSVPHISYVTGETDVTFLRDRYHTLANTNQFRHMEYSEDPAELASWTPLMFAGRKSGEPIAMTRVPGGTDVNFGEVTRQMYQLLIAEGVQVHVRREVTNLEKLVNGQWLVSVKNLDNGAVTQVQARFVFVGAGGTAVHLLQKSGIPEVKGYGGFPVSGQFLRCTHQDVIEHHAAKVYGQPAVDAPPMSMPHLDTRVVNGERVLLFGPFAGFSPKFLKHGSVFDLISTTRPDNIRTYFDVARDELALSLYLVGQIMQSKEDRIQTLRNFVPEARVEDWKLFGAGMRVQTMKRGPGGRGRLEFGTEVITAEDGTIAGLLGASPGASTAVSIMLTTLQRCFPYEFVRWQSRLETLVPSFGHDLSTDLPLLEELEQRSMRALNLVG